MSFQHTVKIPKERIGVLIGKSGKVKQQIEERCGVKIEIDSETGDTMIIGNFREIKLTTEAIAMLAKGSMHKTVYNMLQGAKRKDKLDKMRLWEENPDEIKFSDS